MAKNNDDIDIRTIAKELDATDFYTLPSEFWEWSKEKMEGKSAKKRLFADLIEKTIEHILPSSPDLDFAGVRKTTSAESELEYKVDNIRIEITIVGMGNEERKRVGIEIFDLVLDNVIVCQQIRLQSPYWDEMIATIGDIDDFFFASVAVGQYKMIIEMEDAEIIIEKVLIQ